MFRTKMKSSEASRSLPGHASIILGGLAIYQRFKHECLWYHSIYGLPDRSSFASNSMPHVKKSLLFVQKCLVYRKVRFQNTLSIRHSINIRIFLYMCVQYVYIIYFWKQQWLSICFIRISPQSSSSERASAAARSAASASEHSCNVRVRM